MPAWRQAEICTARTARFASVCDCCHRPRLAHRDLEIIRLIARGHANAKIAYELHISPATVKNRLGELYRRYRLAGRSPLVLWALRQHVIAVRDLEPAQCRVADNG